MSSGEWCVYMHQHWFVTGVRVRMDPNMQQHELELITVRDLQSVGVEVPAFFPAMGR
jgi:hypothetical protein